MALEFRRLAPGRHSIVPQQDDWQAWLFLMQHFRLPTRLLDWSKSALVAAYFAVQDDGKKGADARIWGLRPGLLNKNEVLKPIVLHSRMEYVRRLLSDLFGEPSDVPTNPPRAVAIAPEHIDARMAVQQATFTLHPSSEPLDELPGVEEFLWSAKIPASAREKIQHQLALLRIDRMTLFPDLENLAYELSRKRYLRS